MAGNLAKLGMHSRRQTPRRHWAIVSRLSTTAGVTVLPTMANVPKIHARTAGYILDDLRRRRLAVDKLLQEVGLEKADLANPENRLPQTPVFHLMERAASLTGDSSYGLRLGASVNPRDRGLLGFIALNSPTLIDAMANIQRFYRRWGVEDMTVRSSVSARRWRFDSGSPIPRCAGWGAHLGVPCGHGRARLSRHDLAVDLTGSG